MKAMIKRIRLFVLDKIVPGYRWVKLHPDSTTGLETSVSRVDIEHMAFPVANKDINELPLKAYNPFKDRHYATLNLPEIDERHGHIDGSFAKGTWRIAEKLIEILLAEAGYAAEASRGELSVSSFLYMSADILKLTSIKILARPLQESIVRMPPKLQESHRL